jgi:hypothetical protein
LNSALCTGLGFRKGWKNERVLFCSGEAFPFVDEALEDGDGCDDVLVLATCEAEPLELWLLAELAYELDPPE